VGFDCDGQNASGEFALFCHASSATPQEAIDVANDSAKSRQDSWRKRYLAAGLRHASRGPNEPFLRSVQPETAENWEKTALRRE
jgi:hypothetical protein